MCGEVDRAEKRLGADEPDSRGRVEQDRDTDVGPFLVFSADTEPHIGQQWQLLFRQRAHAARTLGEDLEGVLRSLTHGVPDLFDEVVGDLVVEHVAHRVDEHAARRAPMERLVQAFRMQRDREPVGKRLVVLQGDAFCVAVVAAGRDFVAAGDGIPGLVGPFDGSQAFRLSRVRAARPGVWACG